MRAACLAARLCCVGELMRLLCCFAIGCRKLQVSFRKSAINYRTLMYLKSVCIYPLGCDVWMSWRDSDAFVDILRGVPRTFKSLCDEWCVACTVGPLGCHVGGRFGEIQMRLWIHPEESREHLNRSVMKCCVARSVDSRWDVMWVSVCVCG